MSTDRANDKQVDQDGTLAETAAAAETEISDETLEAVAGGKSLEAYNATPLERSNAIPTDPVRISLSSPTHGGCCNPGQGASANHDEAPLILLKTTSSIQLALPYFRQGDIQSVWLNDRPVSFNELKRGNHMQHVALLKLDGTESIALRAICSN